MRPHIDALRAAGNVVVIGTGWPAAANSLRDEAQLGDTPFLVDKTRESYRLVAFKRSPLSFLDPRAAWAYLKAVLAGFRQGKGPKGDVFELGGVLVVAPGGDVVMRRASVYPGDFAAPTKILDALRRAGAASSTLGA